MQIATFKAVVARRINKRGCEDCKIFLKRLLKYFRTNGVCLHVEIWL